MKKVIGMTAVLLVVGGAIALAAGGDKAKHEGPACKKTATCEKAAASCCSEKKACCSAEGECKKAPAPAEVAE